MSDSIRGGLLVAIIIFCLAVYYFVWVREPVAPDPGGFRSGVPYLEQSPAIPENRQMVKNRKAPDFRYVSIDGQVIELSGFVEKKPVVLDFWATWCGPCRMELPKLEEFYKTHSDQVEIIAISDEGRNASAPIAKLVGDMGLSFPVMHDPSHSISRMYPTQGIPYLVFIDKNGVVVGEALGYNPAIGEEIIDTFGLR
jgi:thiol-disulfide isomerase/thioredoxin